MKKQKINFNLNKYCFILLLYFFCFETKAQTMSTYYGFKTNINNPYGLATNSNGNFCYINQSGWPPTIQKINSNGVNSTFVSGNYSPANYNFYYSNINPTILDYDNSGNLYFVDDYNWPRSIQKVQPNGTVSSFFSNSNYTPVGITIDNLGNVYFLNESYNYYNNYDPYNPYYDPYYDPYYNYNPYTYTIYKIDLSGTITTIANSNNNNFSINGLTSDNSGNIYYYKTSNYQNSIEKVDQNGVTTTVVNFINYLKTFTCDNSGNLYYIDQYGSGGIQKVDQYGINSTYITNNLNDPKNLIADNNGNLFFIDYNNGRYNIMTVTNSNNNCTTPNPPSSSDTTVCGGNTTILSSNGIGEMRWYDATTGGNLLYTGNDFTTPVINSDITYYVEGYYCNLSSTRTPVSITKLETPIAVISGNATGNDVVSLTGSGIGNYLWSGGYSTNQATNYFTNSGLYTLTVSNTGCSNSATVSVIVNKFGMSKFGKLITDTTFQVTKNGNINADTYLNKHGKMSASKIDRKLNYKIYTSPASHPNNANDFSNYTNEVNKTSFGLYNGDILLDWSNWSTLNNSGISIPNNGERFSVEVSGYFSPEESGNYLFTCEGDDAVDLFINGVNVANHYGGHGMAGLGSHTGTINLVQGTKYTFRARMQENGGGEGLRVFWRKPSQNSGWYINTTELSSF